MVREVYVTSKYDIISEGAVLVSAGTVGRILSVNEPPVIQQYEVEFSSLGSPVVWVSSEQVNWRDGILGPIRAIVTTRSTVIIDCDFATLYSQNDLLVDYSLTYVGNSINFNTDDGYTINVTSNANNGITVTYTYTG